MNRAPGPPLVCFPFFADPVGGSDVSAAKLIRQIDRRRFEPMVVMHGCSGAVVDLFRAEGVSFEPAPIDRFGPGPLALLGQFRTLARFLRRRGVQIVHTNDGRCHATWALPARLAGARLLWHHRKDPTAKGLRYLAPLLANRVVAVSHFAAPRPGLWSAARKCAVVYSPFDTEAPAVDRAAARAALIDELRCAADARIVGFFGSLVVRKRPLVFVDTIAEIRARAPGIPVVAPIFGEDLEQLTEAVRRRAEERGVADRIHLLGFRYPPERWLAACDVLLVPAVDEPFGRTLIEAMLLGTAVVAAASGGNLEAIRDGENGCLAPPDDAGAFAERCITLLADPAARGTLAETARQQATARFGLRRHAEQIMRLYEIMLAGGRRVAGPDRQPELEEALGSRLK